MFLLCQAADSDYRSISEELTFTNGGSTTMCVQLTIINDEIGENDEFLTLRINGVNLATATIRGNGIGKLKHDYTCI